MLERQEWAHVSQEAETIYREAVRSWMRRSWMLWGGSLNWKHVSVEKKPYTGSRKKNHVGTDIRTRLRSRRRLSHPRPWGGLALEISLLHYFGLLSIRGVVRGVPRLKYLGRSEPADESVMAGLVGAATESNVLANAIRLHGHRRNGSGHL